MSSITNKTDHCMLLHRLLRGKLSKRDDSFEQNTYRTRGISHTYR